MRALLALTLFMISGFSVQAHANATHHIGIGLGPEYGGLGATIERVSDNAKLTLGGGIYSSTSYASTTYGAALMYHRFDIIAADSEQHAVGIGIAPVGREFGYRAQWQDGVGWRYVDGFDNVVHGALVAYNFHPRRAELGGMHVGVSYGYGSRGGRSVSGLNITIGYRFN